MIVVVIARPLADETYRRTAAVTLARDHPHEHVLVDPPTYCHAHRRARPIHVPAYALKLYEEFHPYGTSAYRAVDSSIEVSAKRYRYTGKERDEETGLDSMGVRYCAGWLGRWTSADPIGLGDGVNRFAYVAGNPIGRRDPSGAFAEPTEQEQFARTQAEQAEAELSSGVALNPATEPTPTPEERIQAARLEHKHRVVEGEDPEVGHALGVESVDPTETKYASDDPAESLFWPKGLTNIAKRAPTDSGAYFVVDDGDFAEYFDESGNPLGKERKGQGGPALEPSLPGELVLGAVAGGLANAFRRATGFFVSSPRRVATGRRAAGQADELAGTEVGTVAPGAPQSAGSAATGTINPGQLTSIGPGEWQSSAGLIYGPGSVHGNRVRHVLAHGVPDPTKPVHSVFAGGKANVLKTVDQAWVARGSPMPTDPGAYLVPMGRVVGTAGETSVKIVVRPGTNRIITAFPVH